MWKVKSVMELVYYSQMQPIVIHIGALEIVFGAISLVLLAWLCREWVGARIKSSVQHVYDKQVEDYRFNRLKRQRAERIAEFFAKWIKYRGRESQTLNRREIIEYYSSLNQMSLEMALWIEDKELLEEVMGLMGHNPEAKSIFDLIGEVRKLLLEKEDDFDPYKIVLWPRSEQIDEVYGNKKDE